MMREVRKKSVVPIYGLGAVWLLYCLFFPLYRPWHFLILAVLGIGVYALLSLLFPGKTEYVKEPEKPVASGNADIDALMTEGRRAVDEMKGLKSSIKNAEVCSKIEALIDVTDRIFKDLLDDPSDYRQVKRFSEFYLPTTIKLLHAYDRMGTVEGAGENITGTLNKIESILDTTLQGFKKQLDALFANQALDIETDIVVLENMLKREGLSGKEF